jgi:hypothetical protein
MMLFSELKEKLREISDKSPKGIYAKPCSALDCKCGDLDIELLESDAIKSILENT